MTATTSAPGEDRSARAGLTALDDGRATDVERACADTADWPRGAVARSSSVVEDVGDSSQAGQFESVLAVTRIILVLTLVLGLTACGDDDSGAGFDGGVDGAEAPLADSGDDEDPLEDPAGADDDLVDSIEAYARTQIDADPDALRQLRSAGCAEVDTDLDTGDVEAGEGLDDDVAVSDLDAQVENDEATVSYRLDPGGEMVTDERWVREDGEWKWDNC